MAYTNGVFRIDLVSGSDTARTALTSCTASNPSGSITNIEKTAHGLVTGAIVDLTSFTTWLNSAWKITVVDADNFTLDNATWQATADPSGTVTPRGGSSWSDAWRTITSGATAARIQPGDEIRFAKTAEPVSLGQNATWTDASTTVTLTTAVTKKIEDAITGWTVSTNVTGTTNTSRKIGATSTQLVIGAAFTTGKVAYKEIAGGGTQDFSAYQYINFWIMNTTRAHAAGNFRIALCSDTLGATVVNEIDLPAMQATNSWQPLSLNYGSALSSSIQSVAIYCMTDSGSETIRINNIFASNGDLSLITLIGKSDDVNYNIQSIDGTTIKIDSASTNIGGFGYSGSTSTETLYYRAPFVHTASSVWGAIQEAGAATNAYSQYIGGYNTTNDTRDGVTVIASGATSGASALSNQRYTKFSYFTFARFNTISSGLSEVDFENCIFCGNATAWSISSGTSWAKLTSCKFLNNANSLAIGGTVDFINCEFRSTSSGGGIVAYGLNKVIGCTFANNGTSVTLNDSKLYGDGAVLLRNCILSDVIEVGTSANTYGFLWSFDHDNTPGNHWGFTNGGTVNWQTGTVHASEPGAWKINPSGSQRGQYWPMPLKIAEVACAASALVTVKAWVKKDHATNVAAKLYVQDALYTIDGVSATSTTKASDTSWEELTITFTPTEAGIVPIFVDSWYVAGSSNVYVGTITITQA